MILDKLNSLPHREFTIAKNKLPIALDVSKRTFERWIYTKLGERLEIPADKLAIIANYFGGTIEELFNYEIPQYNTRQLEKLNSNALALELNLTK